MLKMKHKFNNLFSIFVFSSFFVLSFQSCRTVCQIKQPPIPQKKFPSRKANENEKRSVLRRWGRGIKETFREHKRAVVATAVLMAAVMLLRQQLRSPEQPGQTPPGRTSKIKRIEHEINQLHQASVEEFSEYTKKMKSYDDEIKALYRKIKILRKSLTRRDLTEEQRLNRRIKIEQYKKEIPHSREHIIALEKERRAVLAERTAEIEVLKKRKQALEAD